ncbi:MAG: PEP-CTERM sorting domain-containing protein [Alphaproteobacteria bacterium]|nr:PEP-CTERM sorting domain-containing protein [Alphaproteobacteria bacterium]
MVCARTAGKGNFFMSRIAECLRGQQLRGGIALFLTAAAASPAFADTLVYDGDGANDLFSNVANWREGTIPSDGDSILLLSVDPAINDLVDLNLASITYFGASVPLSGNGLTLSGGVTIDNSSANTQTISVDSITLGTSQTWRQTVTRDALFITSDVDLNGNTLTFESRSTDASEIKGTISNGRLTKTGEGTLILSGANTYAGRTLFEGGTVQVSKDVNLGGKSGGLVPVFGDLVFDGGTLATTHSFRSERDTTLAAGGGTFNTIAGTYTLDGRITGSGKLIKTGGGTLEIDSVPVNPFGGQNSYTGGTEIRGGTISVDNETALGDVGSAVELHGGALRATETFSSARTVVLGAEGGMIDVRSSDLFPTSEPRLTQTGDVTGAGPLTKTGVGELVLSGAKSFTGLVTVRDGKLGVTEDGALGAASNEVVLQGGNLNARGSFTTDRSFQLTDQGGAFEVIGGRTLVVDGTISGAYALVKQGDGTLVLSGQQKSHLGTVVKGGTLQIDSDAGLGDASGSLTLDDGALRTTGVLSTSRNTILGGFSDKGTFEVGSGTLTHNGTISNGSNGFFSDASKLFKTGSGTLVLSGANSYSGGTFIEEGVLRVSGDASLGASGRAIHIGEGVLNAAASFNTGRGVVLDSRGEIDVDGGAVLTLTGRVSGNGLTKSGGGTLVLDRSNSYTGKTTISGGVLEISSDANLSADGGLIALAGGALRTTGSFTTARDTILLSGPGTFVVASGTTLTHDGTISGAGFLRKSNDGTLVLGGSNSYAGPTLISGGTIAVSSDANLGAATGSITMDGGTLRATASFATARDTDIGFFGGMIDTDVGATLTHSGVIGGGRLTKTGGGDLRLTGTNSHAGGTAIDGGRLSVSRDANLGRSDGELLFDGGILITTQGFSTARNTTLGAGGGTFQVALGTTLTHTGDITGAGGLTKLANGTLNLAGGGALDVGGATNVQVGTLRIENRTSQFNGAFANGATTEIEGANVTFAQGAVNDGTFVSNNSTVTFGGGFVNNGTLITDPNTMNFTDWTNTDPAATIAAAGDVFNVSGDLLGDTANSTTWDTDEAILRFVAGTDNAHAMQLYGIDLGVGALGLADNFAWGTVELEAGQTLALDDIKNDSLAGALYLDTILLADFATDVGDFVIDSIFGNGFNVYYNAFAGGNLYLGGLTYNLAGGGQLIAFNGDGTVFEPPTAEAPEPATLALFGFALAGLGAMRRRRAA